MAFDFKKEYKEFYLPPEKPVIVTVPKANYIADTAKAIQTMKMAHINRPSASCMQLPTP